MDAQPNSGQTKRHTVAEAAQILGINPEAVRSRIKRGTLRSEKEGGTVYVLLDTDQTRPNAGPTVDQPLVESLQSQVAYLREQLDRANERDQENRRLLAAALERIPPQLEPAHDEPSEPPEAPVTASESDRAEPSEDTRPGRPNLTSFLALATWIGVGSVPLLANLLAERLSPTGEPSPWGNLALVLFVLPFILGLYRGTMFRRRFAARRGFDDWKKWPRTAPTNVETMGVFVTAGGAACVVLFESAVVYGPKTLVSGDAWLPALLVFIASFMFYLFALLIGVAASEPQDRRDVTQSHTIDGRLQSARWWNPQVIVGLVGTVITAAATIYAAFVGG